MLHENDDIEGEIEQKKQAKDQIEISCPLFLRPLMKEILSVGKSIKIIRYLENNQIHTNRMRNEKETGMQTLVQLNDRVAQPAQKEPWANMGHSLNHQGIFYDKLCRKNVEVVEMSLSKIDDELNELDKNRALLRRPLDFMNFNRDKPSFEVEAIANNLIHSDAQQNLQDNDLNKDGNKNDHISKKQENLAA